MEEINQIEDSFRRLVAIMEKLLSPEGCPWDREQTHESLIPYLIEEAYEVKEDILTGDWDNVRAELGDVALQVVFHSVMARREGRFDIDDVMKTICEKLIRRHPHVFGDAGSLTTSQVLNNWEEIKKQEKKMQGREQPEKPTSLLDGIPESLPALQRAQRMQEKASNVGFDWDNIEDVWGKVHEEIDELKEAYESKKKDRFEDEMGDLIFALVNLSRFQDVWAEIALGKTIQKFTRRFHYIEETARSQGRELSSMSLQEMDELWEKAKKSKPPASDK